MPIFGNRATFAIEAMIEPHLIPPSHAWGRMCIWCDGVSIGDIEEEHCGLEALNAFSNLANRLNDLWLPEFEGLSDLELWDLLDGLLYGYHGDIEIEDKRTLEQIDLDSSKYMKFSFLTNWGEMFDRGGKSFIFHYPIGQIKILNRHLPESRGISLSTSTEAFCFAVQEANSWFYQQWMALKSAPPA